MKPYVILTMACFDSSAHTSRVSGLKRYGIASRRNIVIVDHSAWDVLLL